MKKIVSSSWNREEKKLFTWHRFEPQHLCKALLLHGATPVSQLFSKTTAWLASPLTSNTQLCSSHSTNLACVSTLFWLFKFFLKAQNKWLIHGQYVTSLSTSRAQAVPFQQSLLQFNYVSKYFQAHVTCKMLCPVSGECTRTGRG